MKVTNRVHAVQHLPPHPNTYRFNLAFGQGLWLVRMFLPFRAAAFPPDYLGFPQTFRRGHVNNIFGLFWDLLTFWAHNPHPKALLAAFQALLLIILARGFAVAAFLTQPHLTCSFVCSWPELGPIIGQCSGPPFSNAPPHTHQGRYGHASTRGTRNLRIP